MKIGVIGLGYWGPNLVRNFQAHKDVKKVIACDIQRKQASGNQRKISCS